MLRRGGTGFRASSFHALDIPGVGCWNGFLRWSHSGCNDAPALAIADRVALRDCRGIRTSLRLSVAGAVDHARSDVLFAQDIQRQLRHVYTAAVCDGAKRLARPKAGEPARALPNTEARSAVCWVDHCGGFFSGPGGSRADYRSRLVDVGGRVARDLLCIFSGGRKGGNRRRADRRCFRGLRGGCADTDEALAFGTGKFWTLRVRSRPCVDRSGRSFLDE